MYLLMIILMILLNGLGGLLINYGIIFLANQIINKDLNNRINKDLFLKLGYKLNTVPAELIFPLIIYKEQCGPFSEFVKKNLETDLNIHDIKIKKPAIVEKIIKRAEFFNKHMEFYHKSISGIGMLHDYYKMVYRPLKKPKKSPAQNEAHFGYLKN